MNLEERFQPSLLRWLRARRLSSKRYAKIKRVDTSRGDRVILFTLVDLLTQLLFLAFFLVVVYQQTNEVLSAELQRKLAPYQRAAGPELASFINALSKLVPLADVDKSPVGESKDVTARYNIEALASLLSYFNTEHISPGEAMLFAKQQRALAASDKADFSSLISVAKKMNPVQLDKLLVQAREIEIPVCFKGAFAFSVREVGGGYVFSDPLAPIVGRFRVISSGFHPSGNGYFVPESTFDSFGKMLDDSFRDCKIRVSESSETNDEGQYKHLGQYFWLGGP